MRKKFIVPISLCLILAVASLYFPVFKTYVEGELVSGDIIIRGFNMAEFSPFGSCLIAIPIVLIGLLFGKIRREIKMLSLFVIYIFNVFSAFYACYYAKQWIDDVATGFVQMKGYIIFYVFFMTLSFVQIYLKFNEDKLMEEKKVFEEL